MNRRVALARPKSPAGVRAWTKLVVLTVKSTTPLTGQSYPSLLDPSSPQLVAGHAHSGQTGAQGGGVSFYEVVES